MTEYVHGSRSGRWVSAGQSTAHRARNCPTALPYADRVRPLAIAAAKNSRNRSPAAGPASTIPAGQRDRDRVGTFDFPPGQRRRHQRLAHPDVSPFPTSFSNRS